MKTLLTALHKAKQEIGKVEKSSTNPHFNKKYADINSLLETVEPVLLKHGLLIMQPIIERKVTTIIYHVESGEQITSEMQLSEEKNPQKIGSEVTYFRRYTLQSLMSLQAEDDDANLAASKSLKPLTHEGFTYLMEKASLNELKTALNTRQLTQEQRDKINERIANSTK